MANNGFSVADLYKKRGMEMSESAKKLQSWDGNTSKYAGMTPSYMTKNAESTSGGGFSVADLYAKRGVTPSTSSLSVIASGDSTIGRYNSKITDASNRYNSLLSRLNNAIESYGKDYGTSKSNSKSVANSRNEFASIRNDIQAMLDELGDYNLYATREEEFKNALDELLKATDSASLDARSRIAAYNNPATQSLMKANDNAAYSQMLNEKLQNSPQMALYNSMLDSMGGEDKATAASTAPYFWQFEESPVRQDQLLGELTQRYSNIANQYPRGTDTRDKYLGLATDTQNTRDQLSAYRSALVAATEDEQLNREIERLKAIDIDTAISTVQQTIDEKDAKVQTMSKYWDEQAWMNDENTEAPDYEEYQRELAELEKYQLILDRLYADKDAERASQYTVLDSEIKANFGHTYNPSRLFDRINESLYEDPYAGDAIDYGLDQYVEANMSDDVKTSSYPIAQRPEHYMTQEERDTYNTLYFRESEESANAYFERLKPVLEARGAQQVMAEAKQFTEDYPIWAGLQARGSNALKPITSAFMIGDILSGNGINENSAANLNTSVANLVDSYAPEVMNYTGDAQILGRDLDQFLYGTISSVIDSGVRILTASFLGGGGSGATLRENIKGLSRATGALMSLEVFPTVVLQEKEKGRSDAEAVVLGTLRAAIEGLTEKYSIEMLFSPSRNFGTQLLKGAVAEGSEEIAATVLNGAVDIIAGDKDNIIAEFERRVAMGINPSEALADILLERGKSTLVDGLSGALSGLLFTAGGGAAGAFETSSEAKTASQTIEGAKALVEQVLAENPNNKVALNAQKQLASGKNISARTAQKLINANEDVALKNDQQKVTEAVIKELTNRGEVTAVRETAAAIAKAVSGENLSDGELRSIEGSVFGTQIYNEITGKAEGGEWLNQLREDLDILKIAPQTKKQEPRAKRVTVRNADATTKSGERVQILGLQAQDDGTVSVKVRGTNGAESVVAASELKMSEESQDLVEGVAEFKGAAPAVYAAYMPTNDVDIFLKDAAFVSTMAQSVAASNKNDGSAMLRYLKDSRLVSNLADVQIDTIFEATLAEAKKTLSSAQGAVTSGKGNFTWNVETRSEESLRGREATAVRFMRNLAAIYPDIDIEIFESDVKNGLYQGEQGSYRDGKIRIDLNAGKYSVDDQIESAMLRTLSHELTHHLQHTAPKQYAALKAFITEHLAEWNDGKTLDELITQKQMRSTVELSDDAAMDEVVADACEMMLKNSKAIQQLAAENKSLFAKIRDFVKKFLSDLRRAFAGVEANDAAAKYLQKFESEMQKLWDEAFTASAQNARSNAVPAGYTAAEMQRAEETTQMSNEEAFADSETAVQYQIRPPYTDGSKAFNTFVDGLNPEARKTFDLFYGFYQRSRITNALSVNGKTVKAVNISSLYLMAQDWNDMLAKEAKWAAAAKELADFLPASVRKNMRMNEDGTLIPSKMEEEFKMPSSLAQRLVDALPLEKIDAVYPLGNKTINLPEGQARQSVGGEAYRRAIIDETRKLYAEGKLRKVGIGTMSKDRWGSLGFLAANGKTGASGDFTTVCPQMMYNRGCWYCYRRAAMEKGVNNKLVAQRVWYTGEILRIRDSDIQTLNENGGLRIQSFGDWMPHFSAMMADVLYDAELRGLQVKIITKEPSMINYIAALREQGIGKNLYFNLSADYTIERGPSSVASGIDSLDVVNPERQFMRAADNSFWWKRAMTVEEAAQYRKKYPWVNTRIVASTRDEFIRGLKDSRVDVVTGYHGNIRKYERVDSTTGERKVNVEALGDAGMPRFSFNPLTNTWNTEYEGKTSTHKALAQEIVENGLQYEYYIKTCCITGRCATCKGKCGALARDFNIKNATNRDAESVAYWQREMQYGIEPEFGDLTQFSERGQKNNAPEGEVQYALRNDIVDVNGKQYDTVVELDKKIQKRILSSPKLFYQHIKKNFAGKRIPVKDASGNIEIIEFARDGETTQKNSNPHPVLGELGYTRGDTRKLVIVNIDEVARVSDYDPVYSNTNNDHDWLDQNGWESRTTYVLAPDDMIYKAFLKIAKARDGRNILYAVNLNINNGIAVDKGATAKRAAVLSAMPSKKSVPNNSNKSQAQNSDRDYEAAEIADLENEIAVLERRLGESMRANSGMTESIKSRIQTIERSTKLTQTALQKRTQELERIQKRYENENRASERYRLDEVISNKQKEINRLTRKLESNASQLRDLQSTASMSRDEISAQLLETRKKLEERQAAYAKNLSNYRERRNESESKSYYRERVMKRIRDMQDMLITNSDKKHIPEILKEPLGNFLMSLDTSSATKLKGKGETKRDVEMIQRTAQLKDALNKARNATGAGGYLDISDEFIDKQFEEMVTAINSIYAGMDVAGTDPITLMSAAQLKNLNFVLRTLQKSISDMNKLMATARFHTVAEAAESTITELDQILEYQMKGKWAEALRSTINWKNTTPVYAFDRMGEAGKELFKAMWEAQGEFAFHTKEILETREGFVSDKQVRKWSQDVQTIQLSDNRSIRMTTAQMMAFYCLTKRQQALDHLKTGGIRISNIEYGRNHIQQARAYHLSADDIVKIANMVKGDAKRVADQLQQYMTERGSEWGNQISMARFGYRAFTEPVYFPIRTESSQIAKDTKSTQENSINRLLNMSFTKSTQPNASTSVVIDNIFDVFSAHMSDMAKYNAFALPVLDMIKWFDYNVQERLEDGVQKDHRAVKTSIESAYGKDALNYISTFLEDVNGADEGGRTRSAGWAQKLTSHYKAAAVGANLRVAIQQPTSYWRAAAVLNPKYLAIGEKVMWHNTAKVKKEMEQYAGISIWKSLGFRDFNVGRSVREQIAGTLSAAELTYDATMEASMWLASAADTWTWCRIWEACKAEVKATQKLSGEELMHATAERFNEVIARTQVVDSVMTRSHTMRSKNLLDQLTTPFMAEPTLSYNVVSSALFEYSTEVRRSNKQTAWKKYGKHIGRAALVFILSSSWTAVFQSLSDATRDDDDYEEFWKKFLDAMLPGGKVEKSFKEDPLGWIEEILDQGNLLSNLNLANNIPGVHRTFLNALKGFAGDAMWQEGLKNLLNAAGAAGELVALEAGWTDKATDKTWNGNMTWWGAMQKGLQAFSQLTSLPIYNMVRDVTALYNTTVQEFFGRQDLKLLSYDPGTEGRIANAYADGFLTFDEAMGEMLKFGVSQDKAYETLMKSAGFGKYDELREAIVNGGDVNAVMEKLTGYGIKEDLITNNVKAIIKDLVLGTEDEPPMIDKKTAKNLLIQYLGMTVPEAHYTVEAYGEENFSKYDDLRDAILNGGDVQAAMDELTEYGTKESDVLSEIRASIKVWYQGETKDDGTVVEPVIDKDRAVELLVQYGDRDEDEATELVTEWSLTVDTGVKDIKESFIAGDLTTDEAIDYRMTYYGQSEEDAAQTVAEWIFEDEYGFSYNDRIGQFKDGNLSADELVDVMVEYGGKTDAEAKASVAGYAKEAYADGQFTRDEALSVMTNSGGMTSDEADKRLRYIDVSAQFPDITVDDAWVNEYYDEVESSGISINVFIEYRNNVKDISGEGKKARRMDVINSMPISNAQKDALYYAEGWAASTIHEAPWH